MALRTISPSRHSRWKPANDIKQTNLPALCFANLCFWQWPWLLQLSHKKGRRRLPDSQEVEPLLFILKNIWKKRKKNRCILWNALLTMWDTHTHTPRLSTMAKHMTWGQWCREGGIPANRLKLNHFNKHQYSSRKGKIEFSSLSWKCRICKSECKRMKIERLKKVALSLHIEYNVCIYVYTHCYVIYVDYFKMNSHRHR